MARERPWLEPGDAAPRFTLPAVNREGTVSLDDYVGRSAVLVGLFRGLHCPFCRRQLALLGRMDERLRAAAVETLAVVNTTLERARLYFRYSPVPMVVAADPDAATHRMFGVPAITFVQTEDASRWPWRITMPEFERAAINPTGELPSPMNGFAANAALNARDGFQLTPTDEQIVAAHGGQLAAHYLIDRDGIIRWISIEARESPTGIGRFPSAETLVAAARALS